MKSIILFTVMFLSSVHSAFALTGQCPTSIDNSFESVPTGWTKTNSTGTFKAAETDTFGTGPGIRCWYSMSTGTGDSYVYKVYSGYKCTITDAATGKYSCLPTVH